jgi:hypothetical protein
VAVDGGALRQGDGGTIDGNLTNEGRVATGGTHMVGDFQQGSGAQLNVTFGALSGGFTTHGLGIAVTPETQEIDALITPQIAASPASLPPGGTVTISGASFPLGDLSLTLDGSPAPAHDCRRRYGP